MSTFIFALFSRMFLNVSVAVLVYLASTHLGFSDSLPASHVRYSRSAFSLFRKLRRAVRIFSGSLSSWSALPWKATKSFQWPSSSLLHSRKNSSATCA